MPGYGASTGNRITTDGEWTFDYDDAGRVTGKSKVGEAWEYEYDHRGSLVRATKTDGLGGVLGEAVYKHDAWGNLIRRTETDVFGAVVADERYAVDGWDTAKMTPVGNEQFDTWADVDATGNVLTRRLFGAGFDDVVAKLQGGVVSWYGTDRQGSVRTILDNSGVVVASSDFDAWGNVTAGALTDRYGFTGLDWDGFTRLWMPANGRPYDSGSGRWLAGDEKGFDAGDVNLSRYVGNGPTNGVDPSGFYVVGPVEDIYRFRKWLSAKLKLPTGLDARFDDSDVSQVPTTPYRFTTLGVVAFNPKHTEQIRKVLGDEYGETAAKWITEAIFSVNQTGYLAFKAEDSIPSISKHKNELNRFDFEKVFETTTIAEWLNERKFGKRSGSEVSVSGTAQLGPRLTENEQIVESWTNGIMRGNGSGMAIWGPGGVVETAIASSGYPGGQSSPLLPAPPYRLFAYGAPLVPMSFTRPGREPLKYQSFSISKYSHIQPLKSSGSNEWPADVPADVRRIAEAAMRTIGADPTSPPKWAEGTTMTLASDSPAPLNPLEMLAISRRYKLELTHIEVMLSNSTSVHHYLFGRGNDGVSMTKDAILDKYPDVKEYRVTHTQPKSSTLSKEDLIAAIHGPSYLTAISFNSSEEAKGDPISIHWVTPKLAALHLNLRMKISNPPDATYYLRPDMLSKPDLARIRDLLDQK